MTDRIELILKTQNLTPTQFADAIGIQRSSMSHILARRNKPSLDFAMKLLNRFPEINAEWLLTGKNQMFNGGAPSPALFPQETAQMNPQTPEFEWGQSETLQEPQRPADASRASASGERFDGVYPERNQGVQQSVAEALEATDKHEKIRPASKPDSNQNSDIERIIVFFADGTFKSYS
jgi:transcriptional regulator with XRE-family HTH domain